MVFSETQLGETYGRSLIRGMGTALTLRREERNMRRLAAVRRPLPHELGAEQAVVLPTRHHVDVKMGDALADLVVDGDELPSGRMSLPWGSASAFLGRTLHPRPLIRPTTFGCWTQDTAGPYIGTGASSRDVRRLFDN